MMDSHSDSQTVIKSSINRELEDKWTVFRWTDSEKSETEAGTQTVRQLDSL